MGNVAGKGDQFAVAGKYRQHQDDVVQVLTILVGIVENEGLAGAYGCELILVVDPVHCRGQGVHLNRRAFGLCHGVAAGIENGGTKIP